MTAACFYCGEAVAVHDVDEVAACRACQSEAKRQLERSRDRELQAGAQFRGRERETRDDWRVHRGRR